MALCVDAYFTNFVLVAKCLSNVTMVYNEYYYVTCAVIGNIYISASFKYMNIGKCKIFIGTPVLYCYRNL